MFSSEKRSFQRSLQGFSYMPTLRSETISGAWKSFINDEKHFYFTLKPFLFLL